MPIILQKSSATNRREFNQPRRRPEEAKPKSRRNPSTPKQKLVRKNDENYACHAVAQPSENRVPRRHESSPLALRPQKNEKIDKSKKLKSSPNKSNCATTTSKCLTLHREPRNNHKQKLCDIRRRTTRKPSCCKI